MKFALLVPGPNPWTKSRRFGPRAKNQIGWPNFLEQMCHKFSGLRMKNEAIFSNEDQISGYDSKKTVCSTFDLQGWGCSKAIAAQIAASCNLPSWSRHSSTESRCGSMTDENDRRKWSNFSEIGLAFLDGPAWALATRTILVKVNFVTLVSQDKYFWPLSI
jgi:hypothetical protein